MKLGVIQSNYIPWRGYFDFIASVDTFVIYDDVQYSKGSWRNRNQLKFSDGLKWITLPVKVNLGMNINEVKIDHSKNWQHLHREQLKTALARAPFFREAMDIWETCISFNDAYLSHLNERLIKSICEYLSIRTTIVRSEAYDLSGNQTDRLMDLFKKMKATCYLSGAAADSYLDFALFKKNNISLLYKAYDYEAYPQLHEGFSGTVSILDLIANHGKGSVGFLRSSSPDRSIVQ